MPDWLAANELVLLTYVIPLGTMGSVCVRAGQANIARNIEPVMASKMALVIL